MSFNSFRGSVRPSLGVELEFQLVDARSMALTGVAAEVLSGIPARYQDSVKPEFYDCCVEINTDICRDVAEVGDDLRPKLAATARVAGRLGVLLGWGGTHPFSHWRDQMVLPTPRYRELAERYRESLCRQVTFGLHVHVGVGDGDAAVGVCNRIAEHLPALLALSANSPFWCGRATGLHSHRVEVMGSSPTAGLPPRLGGWDEYEKLVRRLTSAGVIGTAKELWWDVRPSPEHGTVEVRMCDMPPDLPSVLGLTALIQCLVVYLSRGGCDPIDDEAAPMFVRQNRWSASRHGLGADLVDPRTGRTSTARDTIKDLVGRLGGVAAALGCSRHLEHARAMADGASGSERQLALFEQTGDLHEVVRRLIVAPVAGESAPSDPAPDVNDGLKPLHGTWPGPACISHARGRLAPD
jgi:carboxylate-amine ligase